jgi:hypothetical protein
MKGVIQDAKNKHMKRFQTIYCNWLNWDDNKLWIHLKEIVNSYSIRIKLLCGHVLLQKRIIRESAWTEFYWN